MRANKWMEIYGMKQLKALLSYAFHKKSLTGLSNFDEKL